MERLVGRERDLAELWRAFESARAGRGRVVLVSGEGGIGKTTLLDALARRAEAEGARAIWGRCWDGEGAPAYWPIQQLLRSLSAVSPLPDELHELRLRTQDTLELELERFSLFDAVASYLGSVAAASPLVLLVDDLHWADLPTLLLLKLVARTLDRSRILLAGTYREVEARLSPDRRRLLAEIERSGHALPLRGLSAGDVAEIAPPEIAADLHEMTGGNPFFIDEILRFWVADRQQSSGALLSDLPLPDGVRDVIRRRLELLPPEAQRCLAVASVLGRELKIDLLDAMMDRPALDDIDAAVRHEVLRRGSSPGSYRFSHDLIRETLYGDLGERERARHHKRALELLELRSEQANPAELAHHALLALPAGGDRRVAATLCSRAGRHAAGLLAFEQAVAHYRVAIDLVEGDAEALVEALLDCAEAQVASGDPAAAKDSSRRAAQLAEAEGLFALHARAALCFGMRPAFGEVDPELIALLRASLRLLPDEERALRAVVMGRLAAAMQPSLHPEEPIGLAKEAIALASSLGDPRTSATTLASARAAFRVVDSLTDRIEIDEETLALAEQLGDEILQAQAHKRLLHDRLETGDRLRSDVHLAAFERLATRLGRIDLLAEVETTRGMRASLEGRFEEAELCFSSAERISARYRGPAALVSAQAVQQLFFALQRGRRDRLERALELSMDPRVAVLFRGLVLLELGRLKEARTLLESVLGSQERLASSYVGRFLLANAAFAFEDAELAERAYALLIELEERAVVWWAVPGACDGSAAQVLGGLASLLGRDGEAERCFEVALEMNRRLGAIPQVARTERDYARHLRKRGDPRAEALERSARATFERLGMDVYLDAIAPSEETLTLRREGEYWTVTFGAEMGRFKESDGLRYLDLLVRSPGVQIHALELSASLEKKGRRGAVDTGDAGPALDAQAKAAYRRRIEDLEEAIDEATRFGDSTRASAAEAELDLLTEELARAVGLRGRDRKNASAAERARVNVTLRIRKAIEKVGAACPNAGSHLSERIRTGTFLSYTPRR